MMQKTVFITGATSGIGEATARLLAGQRHRLVICGRRKDRLERLCNDISERADGMFLCFDVRDRSAVSEAIDSLPENWRMIDVLINNAGNAHGLAPVQSGAVDDWDAMIDINVKGLLYVSAKIIPGMVSRGEGQIINIGSIAGKEVYPNGNVYCASKHAVDAITSGMRMDLLPHNIRVTSINPGLVETEFSLVRFKGDAARAAQVYEGYQPLTPNDVAETIAFVIDRPAHVNVADLTIFPRAQASAALVKKQM